MKAQEYLFFEVYQGAFEKKAATTSLLPYGSKVPKYWVCTQGF